MEAFDNVHHIIEVGGIVLSFILFLVACFSNVKATLTKMSSVYISIAEEHKTISGSEKMRLVVAWMRDITPRLFRVIFTEEVLEKMVQNVFDDMRKYAEEYFGKTKEEK